MFHPRGAGKGEQGAGSPTAQGPCPAPVSCPGPGAHSSKVARRSRAAIPAQPPQQIPVPAAGRVQCPIHPRARRPLEPRRASTTRTNPCLLQLADASNSQAWTDGESRILLKCLFFRDCSPPPPPPLPASVQQHSQKTKHLWFPWQPDFQ